MKLSDVMAAADLVVYAEVGLVLFMGAFLTVLLRVVWFEKADNYKEIQAIPLRDEAIQSHHQSGVSTLEKEAQK